MKTHILSALFGLAGAAAGSIAFAPGAATAQKGYEPARFGHIIAERIDIVEPDGTLRQALYSKARDPGAVVKGKSYLHPSRTQSGMLFYNDEGTEVGGLIFAGERKEDGTPTSGGALSFDAYEQDQIVQLIGVKEGDMQYSGVIVSDRPSDPIDFAQTDRLARETDPAKRREMAANLAGDGGALRGFFGRASNGDSILALRDGEGKERLRIHVTKAGEAEIVFLDEGGKAVRTLSATK